jgi:hypothetical protein
MNRLCVLASAALLFSLMSTIGFAQSSGSVTLQWGDHPAPGPPPPPPAELYQHPGGPPPHAPAHGYRAKHEYRYYPYRNVYYEQARGLYFYMSGNGWGFGASLPAGLTVASLGTYVSFGLDTVHPYEFNHEHVVKYPKDKYRGKGKDDDDDDDNGNGHGQGKGKGGKK